MVSPEGLGVVFQIFMKVVTNLDLHILVHSPPLKDERRPAHEYAGYKLFVSLCVRKRDLSWLKHIYRVYLWACTCWVIVFQSFLLLQREMYAWSPTMKPLLHKLIKYCHVHISKDKKLKVTCLTWRPVKFTQRAVRFFKSKWMHKYCKSFVSYICFSWMKFQRNYHTVGFVVV